MTLFLILAPYAAFSVLMLVASAALSLFAAAAICLFVIGYDVLRRRSIKMLGAGSAIVFATLGGYLTLVDASLSNSAVRLAVDVGVFAVSLTSLAIRQPFTLQYAREIVDAKTAGLPGFRTVNYVITAAWTGAFLLMMIANFLVLYVPVLPLWSGLVMAFAARNSAAYFTQWYPQYRKAKYAQINAIT